MDQSAKRRSKGLRNRAGKSNGATLINDVMFRCKKFYGLTVAVSDPCNQRIYNKRNKLLIIDPWEPSLESNQE